MEAFVINLIEIKMMESNTNLTLPHLSVASVYDYVHIVRTPLVFCECG